jgi:hypothetical protein
MGLECTTCFHWRPTQSESYKEAGETPGKLGYRKARP